jgi:hypothetical protein
MKICIGATLNDAATNLSLPPGNKYTNHIPNLDKPELTGVIKLQISNHKLQTNYKFQCLSDQAELDSIELSSMIKISLFGILNFFIGICVLFEICYLVLIRRPENLYK